jgi:hypothetical protein
MDRMTSERTFIRVDATHGLIVRVGDDMRPGDIVCDTHAAQSVCVCPVRGTIESISFDPEHHEFVLSVRCETP